MATVTGAGSGDAAAPAVRVIVGATAAGKSALAMWLAERQPVTIVSADSRQIYRRFDVGTAKPTADERARVPHRGIDVVEPHERYSAALWAESADRWIAEAVDAGRAPLVVGGTGLYMRALFAPLFEEPPLDERRRRALEPVLGALSLAELERWCRVLDPARAHLGRTQLLRAIEIALLTGRRLSDLHVSARRPARWTPRYLVVDPGEVLQRRIADRAARMLAEGWPREVRWLAGILSPGAPAWNATGYRTVRRLVEGEIGQREALEEIVIETRQYAKRQRTWFRNQLPAELVTRVDPTAAGWERIVEEWFHQSSVEARA